MGLTFFLSGIGRLSAGVLMDRFAARWVVVAIVVLQTVSFLILAVTGRHWWQVFLFSLTYGVPFGGSIPTRPLMIREMFGYQSFGAINGLAQGVSIASGMVGPLIMGIVFDLTGTYTPALLLFCAHDHCGAAAGVRAAPRRHEPGALRSASVAVIDLPHDVSPHIAS